jgi:hypothetical protein
MVAKRVFVLALVISVVAVLTTYSSANWTQRVQAAGNLSEPTGATMPLGWALTDETGKPVKDGMYDFIFAVYDAETGGTRLWEETQTGIMVTGGEVKVTLGAVHLMPATLADDKNGQYWLAVSVRGPGEEQFTALTPRQPLLAGEINAQALACPHSHFNDYWPGNVSSYGLIVANNGSGDGIRAYSNSSLATYAALYAVNQNGGTGGNGGSAIYASSNGGYAGYFYSSTYRALYASSDSAWWAGYFVNRGGSSSAGLYVDGAVLVTGAKTGYITDLAINDGAESLETGDVVVVTGHGDAVLGEIPLVKVRKATSADSTAVVGVVDQPITVAAPKAGAEKEPPRPAGPSALEANGTAIGQGQYLSIVTLGSFKAIKVDATGRAIQPGDLLVSSANPGYAMASDNPRFGTIIGKAMGTLQSGTGIIPVLITLQ